MSYYGKFGRGRAQTVYGYQGDPGLGGFLKKVAGTALGVGARVLGVATPAGILRTAGGAVIGATVAKVAGGSNAPALPVPPGGAAPPLQVGPVGINLPFAGPPGVGVTLFGGRQPQVVPKGYRLNKTGYWTKEGYVEPGTKYVRVRRRNPLNPRAADRAIARLESAKRATKRLSRISIRSSCAKR